MVIYYGRIRKNIHLNLNKSKFPSGNSRQDGHPEPIVTWGPKKKAENKWVTGVSYNPSTLQ